MPVDHGLLGQPVVEEDVELVAGVEGQARLAVGPDEAIDLGGAAIHLDGAAVDGQGAGAAARAERMGRPARPSRAAHAVPVRRVLRFIRIPLLVASGATALIGIGEIVRRSASGARRLQRRCERQAIDTESVQRPEAHRLPQNYRFRCRDTQQGHAARHGAHPHHGTGQLPMSAAMVAIRLHGSAVTGHIHRHGVRRRGTMFAAREAMAPPATGRTVSRTSSRMARNRDNIANASTLSMRRNFDLPQFEALAPSHDGWVKTYFPLPVRATPARPISLRSPAGKLRALAQDRVLPHYWVRRHRHGRPRRSVAPAYVRCVPRRMSRPTRARPLRRAAL